MKVFDNISADLRFLYIFNKIRYGDAIYLDNSNKNSEKTVENRGKTGRKQGRKPLIFNYDLISILGRIFSSWGSQGRGIALCPFALAYSSLPISASHSGTTELSSAIFS